MKMETGNTRYVKLTISVAWIFCVTNVGVHFVDPISLL